MCANRPNFLCPRLLITLGPGGPTPRPCRGAHEPVTARAAARSLMELESLAGPRLPAQLLHQLLQLHPGIAPAHQERQQTAFAHRNWKTGQLASPFRRHGPRLERGVDPLLLERPANRVFRRATLHALRLQIAEEARRALAPRRAQRGVLLGEAVVIEQAADSEALERRLHGGRRVLLLHEAPLQILPGVRPARERAQRRSLGSLHVG